MDLHSKYTNKKKNKLQNIINEVYIALYITVSSILRRKKTKLFIFMLSNYLNEIIGVKDAQNGRKHY